MRRLLVIGGTGRTGRSALEGLVAGGIPAGDITLLSSRPSAPALADLLQRGFEVVGGNLDSEESLRQVFGQDGGPQAVYIHALSIDAATADPKEVERAQRLAAVLAGSGVRHVVYNSSAGRGCNTGISQMEQKHRIEDILTEAGLPVTHLQATLFMEEFWKKFSRPAILKGTFTFAIPPDKPLQMISVRDMGRVAAIVVTAPEVFIGKALPLAGDALTPLQMAAAFSHAQHDSPAVTYRRVPAWPFWLLRRDLYRICRFYATTGYGVDVDSCRSRFQLQSFADFLQESRWADASIPPI